ncbi:MAG: hypothetical protein V1911_03795 [Candidatus Micrarchaeota archaeon]
MALIQDIIKKYQAEADAINNKTMHNSYATNRDDLFLKVQPRGDPVGCDRSTGLGAGPLWKARKISLNPPAPIVETTAPKVEVVRAEISADVASLRQEVERLRVENTELREKLSNIQLQLA